MAKRGVAGALSEQLNDAVEAIMTHSEAPLQPVDARLTELLRIAADLCDLPSAEFKARLKADLQRSATPRTSAVGSIPAGYHTATPCLVVPDPRRAIEFYKTAFNAAEVLCLADPSGQIMHAEVAIGDSRIALAPEVPDWGNRSPLSLGGSAVIVQLYVDDVDALATQAVAAGAQVLIPVADQFYGDRAGRLADPFGHIWIVATHQEDVTAAEMDRRARAWTQEQAPQRADQPPAGLEQAEDATSPREQEKDDADAATSTPPSVHTVTPFLQVHHVRPTIEFLEAAFAAELVLFDRGGDPPHDHAEVKIGDVVLMVGEVIPGYERTASAFYLSVHDVDAAYQRAQRAGATALQAPKDMPWGHRVAHVKDPYGNSWYLATPKENVPR